MQRCALDQLPFELFRRVIEFIPVDVHYEALCSLALTSKNMRDLAQPALFETVVLETTAAMKSFSELLQSESGSYFAGLVRNLSPWKDDGDDRHYAATIIKLCSNLLNLQTRGSVLALVPEYASDRGYEEAFVWLEIQGLATRTFSRTTRLHVADLQLLVARSIPLDSLISTLTAETLPLLQYFSSSWAPYQMFDEDHDALHDIALAILALPSVTRFIVRVVGMVYDLPTLAKIKDARLRVAAYDERDEVQSNNLEVWRYNALRAQSMWVGRRAPRSREQVVIVAPLANTQQLDVINEEA